MKSPRVVSLLIIALLSCGIVTAEDWAFFRGPRQGHVSGKLPTTWSDKSPFAWSQEIPGKGWSSPVVSKGKVFLTTAVADEEGGYSLRGLCLDASKGTIDWNNEIFKQPASAPKIHSKNSHASPTPIVAGDKVFLHFGHMGTACVDRLGKTLWKNEEHRYRPVHGNGGTPALVNDVLIFSCDGDDKQMVVGLVAETGITKWKIDRKASPGRPFSFGTPLAILVNNQLQVVSAGSDVVMSLNPETGTENWRFRYSGYSQTPVPVEGDGIVYISTGFDSPKLLAIRTDGQGDVTDTHLAWQSGKNAPLTPSPILHEGRLYMVSDNGILSCVDAKTGKYLWQNRLPGNFSASLILADGLLYCLNETGVCFVVKTGEKFEEVARNTVTGTTQASLAASDGKIYLRTETTLHYIK